MPSYSFVRAIPAAANWRKAFCAGEQVNIVTALSARTEPGGEHPLAVRVMEERDRYQRPDTLQGRRRLSRPLAGTTTS